MIRYSFWVKAYYEETENLTLIEDLAYRRLIDHYIVNEGPPTGEPQEIAKIIGMPTHFDAVAFVLKAFFRKQGNQWIHERAHKIIKKALQSRPAADPEPAPVEIYGYIPLHDGSDYPVDLNDVKKWGNLFPGVDVKIELNKMAAWCDANPARRKTKAGVKRFITSWLSRAQDKAKGANGVNIPPAQQPRKFGHD
jgi:hypothetical protein